MTQREKLVELIQNAKKTTKGANCGLERDMLFADYLLGNGVIVPPCKVGDTAWFVLTEKEKCDWYVLRDVVVNFVSCDCYEFIFDMSIFGYINIDRETNKINDPLYDGCIYFTEKEAEKALAEKRADNG